MGWFQTFSDAVYKAACASFNIDPMSQEGLSRFVPAYLQNATTPQALRDSNVCYYAVSERQGTSWDYYMLGSAENKYDVEKTIPVTVLFTFYGPDADDDSEHFWSSLQVDTGYGSPRYLLREERIVLDGIPARPLAVFEVEGTYHRRRCDVRVNFAFLYSQKAPTQTIVSVPEINVVDSLNGNEAI